jgi:tetraacyldisaccharide 4'-kinase
VLLDATQPFGFDHVFPRGTLREPAAGLQRADVVCLTRSDRVDENARIAIRKRVANLAPQAAWCEAAHAPHGLLNSAGRTEPLSMLAGRRVAAFCGIGNPAAFRHALESAGSDVVSWREFPDHHTYTNADLAELSSCIAATNAELVVCTHKDLVKLPFDNLGNRPLWALTVEMQILAGQDTLVAALNGVAQTAATRSS